MPRKKVGETKQAKKVFVPVPCADCGRLIKSEADAIPGSVASGLMVHKGCG